MKEKILVCENLEIFYKNNKIIDNLSFSVDEGDFFLILGKNGIGKSTLLKGILGLICGYMSQEVLLKKEFPSTIWEFVLSSRAVYSKFFYGSKDIAVVKDNLKKLNLWEIKDKSISSLSIGQRQRVLLCRCLCVSEKIIFLDEPTNSLDINVRKMLYDILEKLNKEGLAIVMISHDEEAFKYSNRALVLGKENRVIENVLEKYEKGEINFD